LGATNCLGGGAGGVGGIRSRGGGGGGATIRTGLFTSGTTEKRWLPIVMIKPNIKKRLEHSLKTNDFQMKTKMTENRWCHFQFCSVSNFEGLTPSTIAADSFHRRYEALNLNTKQKQLAQCALF